MVSGPVRIQLSRARGWRMPPNTVKVDRSTRYGNPFKPTDLRMSGPIEGQGKPIGQAGAVEAFRNAVAYHLEHSPVETQLKLDRLRGRNLACWCAIGTPCHADVLLELANAPA